MSESKQALLPLWGTHATARSVHLLAVRRFNDLCEQFVDADFAKDEARMETLCGELRQVALSIGAFKRVQFAKWAAERSANRS